MVLVTLVGAAGFLVPGAVGPAAAARMLAPNGTVRWLAAILLGKLLIWDFPCAFFIKKVRSAVILVSCRHGPRVPSRCTCPSARALLPWSLRALHDPAADLGGFEHAHKGLSTSAPSAR